MSGFDENSKETTEEPVTKLKEITGENGIKGAYKKDNMYFIPTGATLYRGDSRFTDKDDPCLLKDKECKKGASFKFFTPDENYAYKYGLLFKFKTTTDLNLVAMDDISEDFFIKAPKEIQDILEDNYGYSSHKRNSVEEKDYKLSDYICDEKYQGYAANTMKSIGLDDDLNAEVIICNPENHLIPIRRIHRNEDQSKLDELNRRKTEPDRLGARKKPRRDIKDRPKPPSMGSLFEDDEEDDEDNFKPKSLFGSGKTKKSKKSKKKQSKKTKTKTQKKRKSRKSKTNKK